jgi:hypothetical protein
MLAGGRTSGGGGLSRCAGSLASWTKFSKPPGVQAVAEMLAARLRS